MTLTIGLLLLTALSIAAGCVWECRAWEVAVRADLLEAWPDGEDIAYLDSIAAITDRMKPHADLVKLAKGCPDPERYTQDTDQ